jgi:membrane fusion protein (multidrug efflux system)
MNLKNSRMRDCPLQKNRRRILPGPQPRIASTLLVALLAFTSTGCRDEVEPPPQITASPVSVTSVEARHVVDRIEATGQLIAKSKASIASQVGGEITAMEFEEGDAVVSGQLLVRIDPERRELEVASARARLRESQASVEEREREARRLERLRSSNTISEAALDEARTAVNLAASRREAATADLGIAERALRDSQVSAPFDGHVARRLVNAGEYVTPGQTLFELVALDPIDVEFHLAEIDSSRAVLGAPVSVRVAPYPGEVFRAKVSAISPTIDSSTRTLRVKGRLTNADGRLRPGLFARVDLGVNERDDVPMVAEEVVLQRADGAVVFKMGADDRVERVNVRLGVYRDGAVEISEGLAPGDRVVIRGQAELVDGARVELRDIDGNLLEAADRERLAEKKANSGEGSRLE